MSEKPGCRECGGGIYHHRTCSIGVYVSPVLDSERKDFGRMAQATAESLGAIPCCSYCGFTDQSPYRSNGKIIACDSCFERLRFMGLDVDANRARWRIITPTAEVENIAFESKQLDHGYTVKASYLKKSDGDALVEIFKNGSVVRSFLFPAYAVWNIAAHFHEIVDDEIQKFRRSVDYWREDHYAD